MRPENANLNEVVNGSLNHCIFAGDPRLLSQGLRLEKCIDYFREV
jgi:hypothetical protein